MAIIQSGASADLLTIDPTSKAARVSLYDAAGNIITPAGQSSIPVTQPGLLTMGRDYEIARTFRADAMGGIRSTSGNNVLLYDQFTDAAFIDADKWIQTVTTQTITVATATGLTLNASAITTTATASTILSHTFFARYPGGPLRWFGRVRTNHVNNQVMEFGFLNTTGTTVLVQEGAFFRKDTNGTLYGVLASNSTETLTAALTGPATTDYAIYEIMQDTDRITFVVRSSTGALLDQETIEMPVTQTKMLMPVSHVQAGFRLYNNTAPASAGQMFVDYCGVMQMDSFSSRTLQQIAAKMGYTNLRNPVPQSANVTQLANWTQAADATTRTLANTTAAEATLGGLLVANAMAGSATNDLIMFGWQNPTPYTFYLTGVAFDVPLNQVAAVATTPTVFVYGMAFNSSAVSLATAAPYSPMKMALPGLHTAQIALAANAPFTGQPVNYNPQTPMAVQPGRFWHLFCRALAGTATATETFRWAVAVNGFFE